MVRTALKNIVYACWKPSSVEEDCENGGIVDGLWWYKDYRKHVNGEILVAVIEANSVIEDQCQAEFGSLSADGCGVRGMFIGVYDGHAGPEAARFVNDRLIPQCYREDGQGGFRRGLMYQWFCRLECGARFEC